MDEKEIYITAEGLKKLKDELNELENIKLKNIAQKIAEAKDLGDLAENAEYENAKNDQSFIEGRIAEITGMLKSARIIKSHKGYEGMIGVGSKVTVEHKVGASKKTSSFEIVGSSEGDPIAGKISYDSPIGQALMGRKKGEKVEVLVPGRKIVYKIDDVC